MDRENKKVVCAVCRKPLPNRVKIPVDSRRALYLWKFEAEKLR